MSTTDPTAPANRQAEGPQAPEPLTHPGEPTALQRLAEVGRYIDASLLPTANEIPRLLAAIVYGENIHPYVQDLRQGGHADVEITSAVSHVISPPVPGSTATVIQGIDPAQHTALQEQVAELRGLVESLHAERSQLPPGAPAAQVTAAEAPATTSGAGPQGLANVGELTPEQQELIELRQQVQSLRVQEATAGHPVADSEPVPAEAETVPEAETIDSPPPEGQG